MPRPAPTVHPIDPLGVAIAEALRAIAQLPDANAIDGFTLRLHEADMIARIDHKGSWYTPSGHAAMVQARICASLIAAAAACDPQRTVFAPSGLIGIRSRPNVGGGFISLDFPGACVHLNKTHWRRRLRAAWDVVAAGLTPPTVWDESSGHPQWHIIANVGGRYQRNIPGIHAPDAESALRSGLWEDILACRIRGETLRIDKIMRTADVTHVTISRIRSSQSPLDCFVAMALSAADPA